MSADLGFVHRYLPGEERFWPDAPVIARHGW